MISIYDFPLSEETLLEWDGWCLELVNEFLHSHPDGKILYIEPKRGLQYLHTNNPNKFWAYHAVLLLNGKTYDAWNPKVNKTAKEYVQIVFGNTAKWEIIGNE